MFTGDRSGDYLYRAMHRAGFASTPASISNEDELQLTDAWITAAAHCAPPDNKPLPSEIANCSPYLSRELNLISSVKVVLALGKVAFDACLLYLHELGKLEGRGKYRFSHNVAYESEPTLLCSYHPSQQNTSTGRLTESMLDDVFDHARKLIEA